MAIPTLHAPLNGDLNAQTRSGTITLASSGSPSFVAGPFGGQQALLVPVGSFVSRPSSDGTTYLLPERGSIAFRLKAKDLSAIGDRSAVNMGAAGAGNTHVRGWVRSTNQGFRMECSCNNVFGTANGDPAIIDTWVVVILTWDGVNIGNQINYNQVTGTRPAATASWGAVGLNIGGTSAAGSQVDSPISDLMLFDTPLTFNERARLVNTAAPWSWGLLSAGGARVVMNTGGLKGGVMETKT